MQELNEISSKPSARYALALFELSKENKKLSETEEEVDVLKGILTDENELNFFFRNPIYVTGDYEKVFLKICKKLKFSDDLKNTVRLMIKKGRSYDLANFTKDFLRPVRWLRSNSLAKTAGGSEFLSQTSSGNNPNFNTALLTALGHGQRARWTS